LHLRHVSLGFLGGLVKMPSKDTFQADPFFKSKKDPNYLFFKPTFTISEK